jgi:clan AA aspartic protease
MGLIITMLRLSNPKRNEIQPVEVEALADTGSVFLVIPEHVQVQLGLEELEKREVTLADGSRRLVPYVGPVELRFKNRGGYFGALVMGNGVLLGAIPMEDMDLVLLPNERRIDINPRNPNYAHGLVV